MSKKSFILYADMIGVVGKLSDEKAGQLLRMILSHVNGEDVSTDDLVLEIAFEPIKLQLDRDQKKWSDVREARSEAGKKGGRPKKQSEAKKAIGSFDKQSKAKKAVTVNDTVNDTVTDTVNDTENVNNSFEEAWAEYGRKGNKAAALRYWSKLTDADRAEVLERIPLYHADNPDPQYRKDFSGWINPANKMWQDKLKSELKKSTFKPMTEFEPIGEIQAY